MKSLHYIFFIFISLIIVGYVSSLEVFLENGQTGEVEKDINTIDQEVLLQCSFTGGLGSISWYYKPSKSSSSVNRITSETPGFEIVETNLQILEVKPDINGIYICEANPPQDSSGNRGVGSYIVTVLVPPSTPFCGFPHDYAIQLGHSAQFTCTSKEGMPVPTYSWYKDDVLLQSSANTNANVSFDEDTGVLNFKKVESSDEGNYYCTAKNRALPEGISCTAVHITTKDKDVGAIVGIVFGCIFGVLLIAVLIWWTWKKGYCDGFVGKNDDIEGDDDDANDVMLDGTGPIVSKPGSVVNGANDKQKASMLI